MLAFSAFYGHVRLLDTAQSNALRGTYCPSGSLRHSRGLRGGLANFFPGNLRLGRNRNTSHVDDDIVDHRTEHRDTQAIHAKIDESLRAHSNARTDLARLDEQDVEEIAAHRLRARPKDNRVR